MLHHYLTCGCGRCSTASSHSQTTGNYSVTYGTFSSNASNRVSHDEYAEMRREFEKVLTGVEARRLRALVMSRREGERPSVRRLRSQSLPTKMQVRLMHHTAAPRRIA